MNAFDYIPALVAFVALLVGVTGRSKWDSTQTGLRRLTPTGRATIALGTAALLASMLLTIRAHNSADAATQQRDRLRKIAHSEIRLALHQITGPFFILFGDDSAEAQLQLVPPHINDPDRMVSVLRIDVRSKNTSLSGSSYPVPWVEVLKGNADRGATRIDRDMQIYAAYLEPEVLDALSELRTSEFLVLRLQLLDEHVKDNTGAAFLPFPFASPPGMRDRMDFGFEPFWSLINKLDKLLEKDPTRLQRRL